MGKKRIHELAKELSISSGELIEKIMEWKLLPAAKLVASSGLEDHMAEDISRRFGHGGTEVSSAPQVVRRRKKVSQKPEKSTVAAVALKESQPATEDLGNTEKVNTAVEVSASVKPSAEVVRSPSKKPRFESATIIAPPPKGGQVSFSAKVSMPDFKKLIPGVSSAPQEIKSTPSSELVTSPELTSSSEHVASSEPGVSSELLTASETAPPAQTGPDLAGTATPSGVEKPVAARKFTRELSDPPAKIISQPKSNYDSAKVVGSKPNWQGSGAGPRGAGSRPEPREGGGDWSSRRPGGYTPARPGGPGGPVRPGGLGPARPGGPPRPGPGGLGRPAVPGRPPRPGMPGRPSDPRTPDFRRPEPAGTMPAAENEAGRRRNKKKKGVIGAGGRSEADSHLSQDKSTRRRDVVERTDLYSEGDWERVRRRSKGVKKVKTKTEQSVPKAIKRRIKVDDAITVSELAHRLSIKAGDIIKKLMSMGVMASLNQALDFDTATLVSAEFGYEVERSSFDEGHILQLEYGDASAEDIRPPVVTIMGHVDHGKTSLLDYIRKTNIQGGEAGGITQHIGAYHVTAAGRLITFLDTPGHEAFTAMRSRGAQVTDIVILIVAADDGVMPQTREAADHAKAAGVPIVVAINKVDKPGADVDKVRREVMEIGLMPEAWGGNTVFVEVSAKTGQGVDELLDMILLEADILELKARHKGPARGRIIEARLDKGRGPIATVLVQEGCLKQGDTYVCGVFCGRIRAMLDDQGVRVAEVGPAIPVEVQGISGVPLAGDEFIVLEDEKQARQVSQHRLLKQRESELIKTSKLTLENLFDNIKAGAIKGLNVIIKTDVQGSLEAITEVVRKLSTPAMKINIIHQSTGSVSETDVMLASASNALVIGFGVRPSTKVQELAEVEHIQIRYYDVIYKLIDDIKEAMAGLLDPVKSEKILGRAEVRLTFMVTKVGTIAGSFVTDGKILRGSRARLLRDGVVIHDGRISSLKRVKEDAREVASGYECGIGLENYNDVKLGDHIEAYQVEETAATVELIEEALVKAAKDKAAAEKEQAAAEKEQAAAEMKLAAAEKELAATVDED